MFTVFDSRVRYSETDRNGVLSVKSLFDYLQDCCTFQSEDLGESIPVLQERHRAWLLASWDIEIVRAPRRGEKIRVWTWPHYFKRFFAYRGHAVEAEDGTVLVCGNSIWTFVDMENGKALNIPQEEIDLYSQEDRVDLPIGKRKVSCKGEYVEKESLRILSHQIDTNGHMNNSQYILLAADCLPTDFAFRRIRVEYAREAVLGDLMIPKLYSPESGTYVVELNSEDGKRYAAVEFQS